MSHMTPAQIVVLKAAITAKPTWAAFPMTSDGYFDLAVVLNGLAAPAFIVWKGNVSIAATGQAFSGTELAGMTTANQTRLQTIAQYLAGGYNPALADVRQMFNDIWSGAGGALTRANLLVLWKRSATYAEKILATGTGTDAAPATMGYEGLLDASDVFQARNS
jgi:hypothetical protein